MRMFRLLRNWHKWIGVVLAIALATIAVTGFLLATKGTFGWVRPPEKKSEFETVLAEVVSIDRAAQAAFELGIAELQSHKDIDRIDYRPKHNVFKVVSKKGYHEVQVDGKTGKVLQVARRNDQLAEDIHDLSFFHDLAKDWGLPFVAIALLALSISGVCMFFTPILRRAKFNRDARKKT